MSGSFVPCNTLAAPRSQEVLRWGSAVSQCRKGEASVGVCLLEVWDPRFFGGGVGWGAKRAAAILGILTPGGWLADAFAAQVAAEELAGKVGFQGFKSHAQELAGLALKSWGEQNPSCVDGLADSPFCVCLLDLSLNLRAGSK